MDKQFDYKGYVCKIYHFMRGKEITGYGAALYKDGEQLIVNHGWNLIESYSIESVIEECKKYIDKIIVIMKELTTEQKAQRYDKALEKARQLCAYPTTKPFISDLQDLFPELKESEGERIRKTLIHIVKGACSKYGIKYQGKEIGEEKLLSWLEKQGEHNKFREYNKI